jgi:hypothetical protein
MADSMKTHMGAQVLKGHREIFLGVLLGEDVVERTVLGIGAVDVDVKAPIVEGTKVRVAQDMIPV